MDESCSKCHEDDGSIKKMCGCVEKIWIPMREKFGGKMRSRSRICDYEQFCYDLVYILSPNHILIRIKHGLVEIKQK